MFIIRQNWSLEIKVSGAFKTSHQSGFVQQSTIFNAVFRSLIYLFILFIYLFYLLFIFFFYFFFGGGCLSATKRLMSPKNAQTYVLCPLLTTMKRMYDEHGRDLTEAMEAASSRKLVP